MTEQTPNPSSAGDAEKSFRTSGQADAAAPSGDAKTNPGENLGAQPGADLKPPPQTSTAADDQTDNPLEISEELDREISKALDDADAVSLMEQSIAPSEATAAPSSQTQPTPSRKTGQPGGESPDGADDHRFSLDIRRGRVAAVNGEDVFIDLTGVEGKNTGVVPLGQFERAPRIGSIMDFVINRLDESEGLYILSREGAVGRTTFDQLYRGAVVEARVTGTNKGGLELEMVGGIKAFMPASQVDLQRVEDLKALVGTKLPALVDKMEHKSRRVVISRREYLLQQRHNQRKKLWSELEIGQIRQGVVSTIQAYGAFIDLGGVDGLVHVSDMSYSRVGNPEEVLKVNDKVRVKVLGLDPEKQRISLGIKQVDPDPWEQIEQRIAVGDQVAARVVRLADFGAFLEVEPGVEGLLPVSELSWGRVNKAGDVLQVGDVPHVRILKIEPQRHRVLLSIKQSSGDPWVGVEHKYKANSLVEAKVISTPEFGAFVELEPGVEGMVHISELAAGRVGQVTDVLKVGDTRQFRVLQVNEEDRRIKLSVKAVDNLPQEHAAFDHHSDQPHQKRKTAKVRRDDLKGGMDKHDGLGRGLRDLKL